jgi:hypothetical protein
MELTWGGKPPEILFDLEASPVPNEASTVATGVNVLRSSHFGPSIALELIQRLGNRAARRALKITKLLDCRGGFAVPRACTASPFAFSASWWKKRPDLSLRRRHIVAIDLAVRGNLSPEIIYIQRGANLALHRRNIVTINTTICSYISQQQPHRNRKIISDRPVTHPGKIDQETLHITDARKINGHVIAAHDR